jgi:hypothetical protein
MEPYYVDVDVEMWWTRLGDNTLYLDKIESPWIYTPTIYVCFWGSFCGCGLKKVSFKKVWLGVVSWI